MTADLQRREVRAVDNPVRLLAAAKIVRAALARRPVEETPVEPATDTASDAIGGESG